MRISVNDVMFRIKSHKSNKYPLCGVVHMDAL